MKHLKVLFVLVIVGASFVACSPKGRKHPLKQRTADMNAYGANGQWASLATSPYVQLNATDADQRAFITDNFNSEPIGRMMGTEIAMQISISNPSSSRLGILLWDEYAYQNYGYEFASYYGPENMQAITATLQGSNLHAEFLERNANYVVIVDAQVYGGTMSGTIRYGYHNDSNVYNTLGTFSNFPTQGVIY